MLAMLGLRRALLVHGKDGLDQITIAGPTIIRAVLDGEQSAQRTSCW